MLLKSIELENYRPYQGPEKIIFADNDYPNITIIKGGNDKGKTSLLNAFTWCLYGQEYYRSKKNKGKQEPIYNKSATQKLDIGESLEVNVTIVMEDDEGRTVEFNRSQEFTKQGNFRCAPKTNANLTIVRKENDEEEIITITNTYIDNHLPEDLREYYLFDGEQLVDFFDNNKETSLEKAVKNLTQINLIEHFLSHIDQCRRSLNSKLKSFNPSLAQLNEEVTSYKKELEESKATVEENNIAISRNEKKKKDLQTAISKYGNDPKLIINEQQKLERKINTCEKKLVSARKEYKKYIIDNFPLVMGYTDVKNFLELSEGLKKEKFIPAPIQKNFLKELLESKVCICGTELTEDSDCYKEIKKLYEETPEISNHEDQINTLRGNCESFVNKYPDNIKKDIRKLKQEISNLEVLEINPKKEEIKNLKIQLDDINIDDINQKNKEIEHLEESIKKFIEQNAILKNRIENLPSKISRKEKEIEKAEIEEQRQSDLQNKINFCITSRDVAQEILEELQDSIYNKLQKITSEQFTKIHWKESYKKVNIDRDFEVSIEKEDGSIITATDPSSGSQLVLALSFMIALNSLSGFNLPLIIDTPLSRLDDTVRQNLAEFLPEYLKGKQLTLIVTDTEYVGGFKDKLEPYVGKEYLLEYCDDENGEHTRVI